MKLVQAVYALTRHFPVEEKPGLTATIKKVAASIPTKVAESCTPSDPAQSASALAAAQTTLRECAAYLDVAERLRMTARWRFRVARRRAQKVANKLSAMVDDPSAAKPSGLTAKPIT